MLYFTQGSPELYNRIYKHKNKEHPNSFSAKYNCDKLVYYLFLSTIEGAIAMEKRIKESSRTYEKQLIDSFNREWKDLYDSLLNE